MEGRYVVVCFEKNIISISFNIHLESNIYIKNVRGDMNMKVKALKKF